MKIIPKAVFSAAAIAAAVSSAQAGVIIGGTRVIFDGSKKEASINVKNPDGVPYLIQSWIDAQDGGTNKSPFIITPPLYRLDGGQQNVERIVMTGTLPQNKESLFWLNIKTIPSATNQVNALQIAVKTRIKLIYRPQKMPHALPDEDVAKLTWGRVGNQLQVNNPTQYVISFNEINLGGTPLEDVSYVLPGAQAAFPLPVGASGREITFRVINDYGSPGRRYRASL